MKINTLKDLEKLVKLCRKQGITTFKADGMEFQLGSLPYKEKRVILDDPMASISVPKPNIYDPIAEAKALAAQATKAMQDEIKTDELTPEQLMNWSVRQEPGYDQQ